ncbi:MAG: hypothetical protein ACRD0L_12130 [Acidimicrobiales bacterium]
MRSTGRIAAAGTVLALGAAACGSSSGASDSGGSPAALHVVQAAYRTRIKARSAKVSLTEVLKAS